MPFTLVIGPGVTIRGPHIDTLIRMSDTPDDEQPTDPGSVNPRPTASAPWSDDDDGVDDETLRTFVVAVAGLAGALVVVSIIGLLTYAPRKNFIHRHPLLAEMLGMGRHPF